MPPADLVARDGRAFRLLRGALAERLPLKAVALFFAFVLWLAVSADEPGEQTVGVRLALRVDSSLALRGERPSVTATLTGSRRDLLKLRAGDLVLRRTIGVANADSVRLVFRPSDVELPPGYDGEVRVRDVQPRQLTLRFMRAARRGAGPSPAVARPAERPRPAAVTAPAPLDVDDAPGELGDPGAPTELERAPDTLWEAATGAAAAERGETAGDSTAGARADSADSADRVTRGDSASSPNSANSGAGGPPPNIIIRPSDSTGVTTATPLGASPRDRPVSTPTGHRP